MKKSYVASAFLTFKDSQVLALVDFKQNKTLTIDNKYWLTILEIFIHEQSLESAYQKFQETNSTDISEKQLRQCTKVRSDSDDLVVMLANKSLKVLKKGLMSLLNPEYTIDLTAISQENFQVITCLFNSENFSAHEPEINSFETFRQSSEYLERLGLLSPAINTIDWGDLRRRFPLCNLFGFTRGIPINRYYLDKFISDIRPQVAGTVLEVGGVLQNREFYQFSKATEYHTLDIAANPGVTQVGDVHERAMFKPGSLDTVVIFNVLEHCHNPWVVVENIYIWLKVGGKCFCMVPSAQRLHDFPGDYWRPLPDGMQQLFQNFCHQKLYVYGNPLTVVASFMGISAKELSPDELDDFHPDYPVTTCIVAMK
ncbi:methyltransferase domain-containing protein [Nostoc sp.]